MDVQDRTGYRSMKTKQRSTWRNISERTMTTIRRNTFHIRQKKHFLIRGLFLIFRRNYLRIPSLSGKKNFFIRGLFWIFQRDYTENTFPIMQKMLFFILFLNISERLFWEYLPYQAKKHFLIHGLFWIFRRNYPENTFPTRQKKQFFIPGLFWIFKRYLSWEYLPF